MRRLLATIRQAKPRMTVDNIRRQQPALNERLRSVQVAQHQVEQLRSLLERPAKSTSTHRPQSKADKDRAPRDAAGRSDCSDLDT